MDSVVAFFALLCLAGILAVAGAGRQLKVAQHEFQSRLRNAALARARHLLFAALLVWSGAGLLSAFAAPQSADAAARTAVPPAKPGPAVQLRIDTEINFTGR